MNVNKKRKLRRKPGWYFIACIVGILVLYTGMNFTRGVYRIWRLSHIKNEEIKAIHDTEVQIEKLELEIERLKTDSLYIEEIARKEYGMIKKGEEVFHITLPDTTKRGDKDGR